MTGSTGNRGKTRRRIAYTASFSSIALLLVSGCGTIHVVSDPPGAMVFDTRVYPPGTDKEGQKEDVLVAGFTPCSYKKEAKIPAVKVRWPDGSESQWKVGLPDNLGYKDEGFSFNKADASIPTTTITNWFPVVGPKGYVEFYRGKGRPPAAFRIYQNYGTEECLVCDGQSSIDSAINSVTLRRSVNAIQADKSGRLRIPCQPGANAFAVGLGTGRTRVTVNVREDTLTPVQINYTELPKPSKAFIEMPGSNYRIYYFQLDTVVETQRPLGGKH